MDVRPVLCGEVLLKYAVGAVVLSAGPEIAAGVGNNQYGAGRAGGASLEVAEVRAAARARIGGASVGGPAANSVIGCNWLQAHYRCHPPLRIPLLPPRPPAPPLRCLGDEVNLVCSSPLAYLRWGGITCHLPLAMVVLC